MMGETQRFLLVFFVWLPAFLAWTALCGYWSGWHGRDGAYYGGQLGSAALFVWCGGLLTFMMVTSQTPLWMLVYFLVPMVGVMVFGFGLGSAICAVKGKPNPLLNMFRKKA